MNYCLFKLTLTFRWCRTPFAVVVALQRGRADQFVTGVAVVFDARVDIEVVADYVTSGRHFGLLTRDNYRSKKTASIFLLLIFLNIKTTRLLLHNLYTTHVGTRVGQRTISLLWYRSVGGWCGAVASNLVRTYTRRCYRALWSRLLAKPVRFR